MSSTEPTEPAPRGTTRLLTVDDVSNLLGCGRTMVYELLGRGEIGHMKIGRLTRIHPTQVELFVHRRMGLDAIEPPVNRRPRRRRAADPDPTLPFDR